MGATAADWATQDELDKLRHQGRAKKAVQVLPNETCTEEPSRKELPEPGKTREVTSIRQHPRMDLDRPI